MSSWDTIPLSEFSGGDWFGVRYLHDVHPALRSETSYSPSRHDSAEGLFDDLFNLADLRFDGEGDKITMPLAQDHDEFDYNRLKRKMPPRDDYVPTTRSVVVRDDVTSLRKARYTLFPMIDVRGDGAVSVQPKLPARSLERSRVVMQTQQQQAAPNQQIQSPPPSLPNDIEPLEISHFPAPPIPLRSRARATTIPAPSISRSDETTEPVLRPLTPQRQRPNSRTSRDTTCSQEVTELTHWSSDSFPPQPPTPTTSFTRARTRTDISPPAKPSPRKHSLPSLSIRTLFHSIPPLVEAARTQDYPLLLSLLAPSSKPLNVDAPDSTGHTPLHHAVLTANLPILLALLSRHASLTATTRTTHRNPLFLSTHHPDGTITAALLAAGSSPDLPSKLDGATPLHKASQLGHVDVMRLLLSHGADPNKKDIEGMPPLMWATQSRSILAARLLLQSGASLESRIKLGANLELSSRQGLTVLHKAVAVGDQELTELFLEGGADVDAEGPNGVRALHRATMRGDLGMVKLLLAWGAEVGARTEEGWTALHFAGRYGILSVWRLLLEAGADEDAVDGKGRTAGDVGVSAGWGV